LRTCFSTPLAWTSSPHRVVRNEPFGRPWTVSFQPADSVGRDLGEQVLAPAGERDPGLEAGGAPGVVGVAQANRGEGPLDGPEEAVWIDLLVAVREQLALVHGAHALRRARRTA
jgi:hypothetical protein